MIDRIVAFTLEDMTQFMRNYQTVFIAVGLGLLCSAFLHYRKTHQVSTEKIAVTTPPAYISTPPSTELLSSVIHKKTDSKQKINIEELQDALQETQRSVEILNAVEPVVQAPLSPNSLKCSVLNTVGDGDWVTDGEWKSKED